MKKTILASLMCMALACPAYAETINGIDFTIPDGWQAFKETDDEDISAKYYSLNNEMVMISVHDLSSLGSDDDITGNLYLFNCDDIYNEKDGYYLMTNQLTEPSTPQTLAQECVFSENGQWWYIYLGSRNYGDHVESIVYQAPTASRRDMFDDFGTLFNDHIAGE